MEIETKYLGIDYGEKRVGIAITDGNKKYSFSRDFMENNVSFFANLLKLLKEENIVKLIIGYPLNMNSEKTIQTLNIETFKNSF